jgi:hypothetical protein
VQSFWNPGRTGLIYNIFTRRDGENGSQRREEQSLLRTGHLPGNNEVAAMTEIMTALEPLLSQTEIMVNQDILVPGTV